MNIAIDSSLVNIWSPAAWLIRNSSDIIQCGFQIEIVFNKSISISQALLRRIENVSEYYALEFKGFGQVGSSSNGQVFYLKKWTARTTFNYKLNQTNQNYYVEIIISLADSTNSVSSPQWKINGDSFSFFVSKQNFYLSLLHYKRKF